MYTGEGIESALRLGQCFKEEGEKNLELYRKLTSGAGKIAGTEYLAVLTEVGRVGHFTAQAPLRRGEG